MKNKSLKFKLLFAFMGVASFVMVIAIASHFSMEKVYTDFSFIDKTIVQNFMRIQKLYNFSHESNRYLMRAYMVRDEKNMKRLLKSANDNFSKFDEVRQEYLKDDFSPGEKEKVDAFFKKWDDYMVYAREFEAYVAKFTPEDSEKAIQLLDGRYREIRLEMYAALEGLNDYHKSLALEKSEDANSVYQQSKWINTVLSLTGLLVALCAGIFFSSKLSSTLHQIADEIKGFADQTTERSEELTSASSQLSQGATESAASLEETVSSLEELSSMVKLNSDHAKEANTLSQTSLSSAEQGEKQISKLISAIEEMAKSSTKIEDIINVIDDIAFQTNLLALNAAVEAARAGDQGKGFAVVAEAVRQLAGRSASAAKDINSLIKDSVAKTHENSQIADSSGKALKEILSSVKKVAELNSEIAAASQEQANGIEQISKAMNHLDQAIQMNASSSEQVASSAEELSVQAELLDDQVGTLVRFVSGGSSHPRPPKVQKETEEIVKLKLAA